MRLIKRIFLALKTFDRPATLREIKRESGLSKDDVHKGLKGLARRSMIIADVLPRRGGTYRLVPGATMPEDMRGRYVRDFDFCERLRRASSGYCAAKSPPSQPTRAHIPAHVPERMFSAASPPAPSNAPGAARLVVKGMIDASSSIDGPLSPPCALAAFWKRR
jgi:hypothetical protein